MILLLLCLNGACVAVLLYDGLYVAISRQPTHLSGIIRVREPPSVLRSFCRVFLSPVK